MISSTPLTAQAHLPKQGEHEPGAPLRLVRFLKLVEKINQRGSIETQEESPKPGPKRGEL